MPWPKSQWINNMIGNSSLCFNPQATFKRLLGNWNNSRTEHEETAREETEQWEMEHWSNRTVKNETLTKNRTV